MTQSKLKLSHQALIGKLAVLDKFDGEILELLSEDELADEIDQADSFTEKLLLVIIDIEQAFKGELNQVGRHTLEDEFNIITTSRTDPSPITNTTTIPFSMESIDILKVRLSKLTLK